MRAQLEVIEIPPGATNIPNWMRNILSDVEAVAKEFEIPGDEVQCKIMMSASQLKELLRHLDFMQSLDRIADRNRVQDRA